MDSFHLPHSAPRSWIALLLAGLAGADLGETLADTLGLGWLGGVLPCCAVFAAALWAGRRALGPATLPFWVAIVVMRAATADLAGADGLTLRLRTILPVAVIGVLLGAASRRRNAAARAGRLPGATARDWCVIVLASLVATFAENLAAWLLGLPPASTVLASLAGALIRGGAQAGPHLVRSGFPVATLLLMVALFLVLRLWPVRAVVPIPA